MLDIGWWRVAAKDVSSDISDRDSASLRSLRWEGFVPYKTVAWVVIKRVSSGKAVKQEKQAVIPGLPVYGSIYLLDLGIEKSLNIEFSFSVLELEPNTATRWSDGNVCIVWNKKLGGDKKNDTAWRGGDWHRAFNWPALLAKEQQLASGDVEMESAAVSF